MNHDDEPIAVVGPRGWRESVRVTESKTESLGERRLLQRVEVTVKEIDPAIEANRLESISS